MQTANLTENRKIWPRGILMHVKLSCHIYRNAILPSLVSFTYAIFVFFHQWIYYLLVIKWYYQKIQIWEKCNSFYKPILFQCFVVSKMYYLHVSEPNEVLLSIKSNNKIKDRMCPITEARRRSKRNPSILHVVWFQSVLASLYNSVNLIT